MAPVVRSVRYGLRIAPRGGANRSLTTRTPLDQGTRTKAGLHSWTIKLTIVSHLRTSEVRVSLVVKLNETVTRGAKQATPGTVKGQKPRARRPSQRNQIADSPVESSAFEKSARFSTDPLASASEAKARSEAEARIRRQVRGRERGSVKGGSCAGACATGAGKGRRARGWR